MEALHTHKNQFGFFPNGPDFQHFLKYGVKNEKQDIFLDFLEPNKQAGSMEKNYLMGCEHPLADPHNHRLSIFDPSH